MLNGLFDYSGAILCPAQRVDKLHFAYIVGGVWRSLAIARAAALTPHTAESLWLSVTTPISSRGYASARRRSLMIIQGGPPESHGLSAVCCGEAAQKHATSTLSR
jgi:hypothetical protein